jgi:hypothetical protein
MSRSRGFFAVVAATAAVALAAISAAPAANATPYTNRPKLTLSSGIVVIVHYMAVTGTGYVPYENVSIAIDKPANVQLVIKADSAGHFVTNVLVPATLPLGTHTVIGTGQFAQNGYDTAKVSVLVVGSLAGIPIAYQHPLAPQLPPVGVASSPTEGWAVVAGITLAALLMLGTGAYVLVTARRRTTVL